MDDYDKKEENSVAGDFKMFIRCKFVNSLQSLKKEVNCPLSLSLRR